MNISRIGPLFVLESQKPSSLLNQSILKHVLHGVGDFVLFGRGALQRCLIHSQVTKSQGPFFVQ